MAGTRHEPARRGSLSRRGVDGEERSEQEETRGGRGQRREERLTHHTSLQQRREEILPSLSAS